MIRNSGSFFSAIPPVTKNLIIINFIIWLAMMLIPGTIGANFTEYGGLHYIGASDFNIAQIVTYMFIHSTGGIAHLFFNMFTLFMFGITLERVLGSKRFLFYYLSCGIGAAIIQEATWALMIDSFVNNNLEMTIANFAHANHLSMEQAYQYVTPSQLATLRASIENALVTVGASCIRHDFPQSPALPDVCTGANQGKMDGARLWSYRACSRSWRGKRRRGSFRSSWRNDIWSIHDSLLEAQRHNKQKWVLLIS